MLELDHEKEAPVGVLEKAGMVIVAPGQTGLMVIGATEGVGLMVIVKAMVSGQSSNVANTVIVAVILAPVLLAGAVHGGMFPVPEAPRPIAVLELDQEKEAPVGVLVKAGIEIRSPGHTEMFETCVITGAGLIVMVKETGLPGHPSSVGVTVIVPVIGEPVLF